MNRSAFWIPICGAHFGRFSLPNEGSLVTAVHTQTAFLLTAFGFGPDALRMGVALEEALNNALYHGNLKISSDERENEDRSVYRRLVEDRKRTRPYNARRIHCDFFMTPLRVDLTVRDEGEGFDKTTIPDCTDPDRIYKFSGRGPKLMHTFADVVAYNEVGNEVHMVKHRVNIA